MAQTVSFDFKNAKAMATDADIAAIKDQVVAAKASGYGFDYQAGWRKPRDAFPSTGCNRTDHYLYRTFACTIRNLKCQHKLVACGNRVSGYHHLQYLGERHVQDHPDFDGCFDFLRGSSDHECGRTYESGWQCDHRI